MAAVGDREVKLPEMCYRINLLEDRSVITEDGEYLGTWSVDETDALHEFTPDGADEPIFMHPYIPFLCDMIEEWHAEQVEQDQHTGFGATVSRP